MLGNWLRFVRSSEVVNPGLLTSKFIVIAPHKTDCRCWHVSVSDSIEDWV